MTEEHWNAFCEFREQFKKKTLEWNRLSDELIPLQKASAGHDTPPYPLETAVVYNRALDEITQKDEIKLIVIGDNPGKDEQLAKNNRYLVGQAGKIAEGFFRKNSSLGVDFRKNAVILNKTPVHTAKTAHLKYLEKHGSSRIKELIEESQIWMAENTAILHQSLKTAGLWLVGYSELKQKGIFTCYRKALADSYRNNLSWQRVLVFQHFSMNRFSIDLKSFMQKNDNLTMEQSIQELGTIRRNEIFL